jgi:Zn-dependent alcohol dehydrogenase
MALMAAKLLSLEKINVFDILNSNLELEKELGATHSVHSSLSDPAAEVMRITGRGLHLQSIAAKCPTSSNF